jgi:polyhydroxybutyrate depolymerase
MKRRLILAAAFVCTLAIAFFAGNNIINALQRTTYTATYSTQVDGMTRSWEVIAPVAALPPKAPIIVMLSGIAAGVNQEAARDHLIPYASAGLAELVYPAGYHQSWNAGGCCGDAAARNVDDVAFLKALVPRVDPGHQHPIYLAGYSNGGRMAYRMACSAPGVFDAIAVAKAMPMPGCVVTHPVTILQIAALDDTAVPFKPGDRGKEAPPATVEVGHLRAIDNCSERTVASAYPAMTLTTWNDCATGTRVEFAVYAAGGHNFPPPRPRTPGADQVVYAFFTSTAVAPLPR